MRLSKTKQYVLMCLLLIGVSSSPVAGFAQGNGDKYGFINMGRVITESDEGVAQAKELESFGAQKEKELLEGQKELEALAKQYEESVKGGQPDEPLKERIEKMRRELERDLRQAQSDVDVSRQDRIQEIGRKAVEIVRKFAEDNGYTVIFRVDGGQVVYINPEAEITDQIIDAYNKAHPVE